ARCIHLDEWVQHRIQPSDTIEARLHHISRTHLAAADSRNGLGERRPRPVLHGLAPAVVASRATRKSNGSTSKSTRRWTDSMAPRSWFSSRGNSSVRAGVSDNRAYASFIACPVGPC